MHLRYLQEKYGAAVEVLATSAAPIQDRLLRAYESHIHGLRPFVEGTKLPTAITDEMRSIAERLQAAQGEGHERSEPAGLRDDEAEAVATSIFRVDRLLNALELERLRQDRSI